MTEALLRARGLRTGLFTSPHLSYDGRADLRGRPAAVAPSGSSRPTRRSSRTWTLVDATHAVPLSFFEVLVGMAFSVFADAPVDVCVLEVGMGGTWDNTNVADGAVAVVTPISIDHSRYLGNTVAEIAADKAGIIKPGAVAVLAQQPPAAAEVLLRRAAEVGASVAREGLEFGVLEPGAGGRRPAARHPRPAWRLRRTSSCRCSARTRRAIWPARSPRLRRSPRTPAAADLAAYPVQGRLAPARAEPRRRRGRWTRDIVRRAVAAMTSPGRLEIVRRSPVVIADAAHNPAGMAASWRR